MIATSARQHGASRFRPSKDRFSWTAAATSLGLIGCVLGSLEAINELVTIAIELLNVMLDTGA